MKSKHGNVLINIFMNKIHTKNENLIVAFVGPTGAGKSYAAIRTAMRLDPNFTIKKRVVYSPTNFMKLIASDLPKGSAIIWDDAGEGLSSKQWYTLMNIIIGWVLQTCRYKNHFIFITVPVQSMLDATARKLFHFFVDMTGKKDMTRNRTVAKVFWVVVNQRMNKTFYINPRIWTPDGKKQITHVIFKKPHARLIRSYEIHKQTTMDAGYLAKLKQIKRIESGDERVLSKRQVDRIIRQLDKATRAKR